MVIRNEVTPLNLSDKVENLSSNQRKVKRGERCKKKLKPCCNGKDMQTFYTLIFYVRPVLAKVNRITPVSVN